MRILVTIPLGALMIICLFRRCNGCLDTLLKSFFQVFNPNVEAGPGRLVSRHPYEDGIMPEFRVSVATAPADDYVSTAEDYEPTADYVDDGVCQKDSARPREADDDDDDGDVEDRVAAVSDDGQLLTDFIVSLLETIQLTSRATLKKSKMKRTADASYSAPPRPSTKTTKRLQRQSSGRRRS